MTWRRFLALHSQRVACFKVNSCFWGFAIVILGVGLASELTASTSAEEGITTSADIAQDLFERAERLRYATVRVRHIYPSVVITDTVGYFYMQCAFSERQQVLR